MDKEQASDLISAYDELLAAAEKTAAVPRPTVDPHAHLPAKGTRLHPHRQIDYRMFISDEYERRKAYELKDPESLSTYFSDCLGTFFVDDYVPDAPMVVARCDACDEPFAYKVAIP